MVKALIVIDMQNDFVSGSLGTTEAQRIVPTIQEILREANEHGDRIYFTQDTHAENYLETQEGKYLPVPHCVAGTPGWNILEELSSYSTPENTYTKRTFGSLKLAHNASFADMDEIILVGVCTDICVISNALILKAAYPEVPITIYENACAGTTPEAHAAALQTGKSCQVNVKTYKK